MSTFPRAIRDTAHLEDLLSEPTLGVIATLRQLRGDILILGVGGKMGASLARMARRATDAAGVKRRIIGVSRFSNRALPAQLNAWGIETITCDLLDRRQLARLPDAPHIIYMPALKFGSAESQSLAWAINAYLPALVCEKFPRSRIVAFSTGNVYPLVPAASRGSRETDPPAPIGEYGMSCLGRERIFEYFSRVHGTPVALIRLNYANEMRYGTLVDIAQKVWCREPIALTTGYLNAIWQADANAMTLQSFAHASSPPFILNIAGKKLSIRKVAEQFGNLLHRKPKFLGKESPTAFLSNAAKSRKLFGAPRVTESQLIRWIADWTMHGGETLNKPTHFETRDGKY
jgi:nucleoside-diphosphate-sugar epimerase